MATQCGNEEEDTDWLASDECQGWYYLTCTDLVSQRQHWICSICSSEQPAPR